MTIHFAPAKGNGRDASCAHVARAMAHIEIGRAANDNDKAKPRAHTARNISDRVFEAALRHFGEYGLGAARAARIKAKQAFFEGDRTAYDWWLDITYVLDRRLAGNIPALASSFDASNGVGTAIRMNTTNDICDFAPDNAG